MYRKAGCCNWYKSVEGELGTLFLPKGRVIGTLRFCSFFRGVSMTIFMIDLSDWSLNRAIHLLGSIPRRCRKGAKVEMCGKLSVSRVDTRFRGLKPVDPHIGICSMAIQIS